MIIFIDRFHTRNSLRKHVKRHVVEEHICEFCGKVSTIFFKTSLLFISTPQSIFLTSFLIYSLQIFTIKADLKKHIRHVHSGIAKKPSPKIQCDICQGWYSTRGHLNNHKLTHSPVPQKCDHCGKISKNSVALTKHIQRVHCEFNFKCHLCYKPFKSRASLKVFIHIPENCELF